MISISVSKQIKTYLGTQQLEVTTSLPEFSITKVTGPSGSGKTTFLKIVAGLITPEKGLIRVGPSVWFDQANGINLSPQLRRAGFVFQDYALFPNMTVQQHLAYATDNAPLARRLLAVGEMEPFASHRPSYLSGGQQQRLAILRAMATSPKVLLMDEPFSALDQQLRSSLMKELKLLLAEFKTTCLIVTHQPDELDSLATHELQILPPGGDQAMLRDPGRN